MKLIVKKLILDTTLILELQSVVLILTVLVVHQVVAVTTAKEDTCGMPPVLNVDLMLEYLDVLNVLIHIIEGQYV